MNNKISKLIFIGIFAAAFGYVEASVVVYLRELYYPNGFLIPFDISFPYIYFGASEYLNVIPVHILTTEVFREAATMFMLASVACLASTKFKHRVAYFLFPFAIWDIFYYIFLKLLIGWPESLATLDVLFLIPVPWIGPVWMPISVSICFIIASILLIKNEAD